MNTQPIILMIQGDTVRIEPQPDFHRFMIQVRTGTAQDKPADDTYTEIGEVHIYRFPTATPVFIPDQFVYRLILRFSCDGVGKIMRECENIITRNGHI